MFLLFILFVLVVIFLLFLVLRSFLRYPTFSSLRFFRVFLLRDPLFSSLRLFARPPRFFVPRFFSRCPSFFRPSVRLMRVFRSFSAYLVKNRHHIEPLCFCTQYVGLQMFTAAER